MIGTYTITYNDILRSMEKGYDTLHREAAEAEIKALPHVVFRILKIHEALDKDSDQSDCSTGYSDVIEKLKSDLQYYEDQYHTLSKKLQKLDPDDVELLSQIYEQRLPLRTIANRRYSSKTSIIRQRDRILDRL